MNPKSISFFALIKQTFSLLFSDSARLKRLCAVPFLLLVFVAVMGMKQPYEVVGEGTPRLVMDYPYLALFSLCLLIVYTLVMVKIHQIVFYGDDGKYFVPHIDLYEVRYLWAFIKIMVAGALFSLLTLFILYVLVQMFMPTENLTMLYALTIGLFCSPYFIIRLFPVLPASVAKDNIGIRKAWKMTRGIGLALSMYYVIALMMPLAVGAVVSFVLFATLPGNIFSEFLMAYTSVLSLLGACMVQAGFMSYAYLVLREQAVMEKNKKESILTVAKTTETD